ncbi:RICIN domain-containing protein [Sinosporangium siamense]|uniref:Ricin B lectin domain-containing protein n=1 Tax=Sinosporangium siamense TaxID=1367973 RepID=A0A919RE46_9ACTN|nr:RICIN domain-containing protein [Sinosporangium siamense]GII92188.1 hypothetical protein Ssi02_24190 [Sinosporangium siamense]
MRTKKLFAIAIAGIVVLAGGFFNPANAGAAFITTWVSVQRPNGATGTKVLDVRDGSQANGARVQIWQRNGYAQQYWTIERTGTSNSLGVYQLTSRHSGKCLDMAIDGTIGNGTRVQQWTCTGATNQRWIARPVVAGNNWVSLVNQRSGLCLDVPNYSYTDGNMLQVWQCHGDWNQRWNIY